MQAFLNRDVLSLPGYCDFPGGLILLQMRGRLRLHHGRPTPLISSQKFHSVPRELRYAAHEL